jgi:hypothetical protein
MNILLALSAIAALVGAYISAIRTYKKLKLQPGSVQESIAPEATQPRLQPDLDSENPVPSHEPAKASGIVFPPMMPQAQAEIPLATSLKISEVVEPATSIEPSLFSEPQSEEHHAVPVLEEVEQLEEFEETLNQLAGKAIDPDHLMRLAVAVELGELAEKGQVNDRLISLLSTLLEDADLEVRVQAGASLAMIPNALAQ